MHYNYYYDHHHSHSSFHSSLAGSQKSTSLFDQALLIHCHSKNFMLYGMY